MICPKCNKEGTCVIGNFFTGCGCDDKKNPPRLFINEVEVDLKPIEDDYVWYSFDVPDFSDIKVGDHIRVFIPVCL